MFFGFGIVIVVFIVYVIYDDFFVVKLLYGYVYGKEYLKIFVM